MNLLKQLWLTLRSNPVFVAFEGGASGAALSYGQDALTAGGAVDWKKFAMAVLLGGVTAVRLLYRPAPGATPTKGN